MRQVYKTMWMMLILLVGLGCEKKTTEPVPEDQEEPDQMVLIPAGEFQMGDAFDKKESDRRPLHMVYVDAFYMDKHEVTNAQYRAFCDAMGRSYPSNPVSKYLKSYPGYPVVNVSWYDATAYCNWRSRQEGLGEVYDETAWGADFTRTGYRLPTEAEWEKGARGDLEGNRYPWGDEDPAGERLNYSDYTGALKDQRADFDEGEGPLSVGSFEPNGYGLYDMAGNVQEWCNDWYAQDYYSKSPANNPTGPTTGISRVLRGGSWFYSAGSCRVAFRYRSLPSGGSNLIGFRCVRTP